MKWLDSNPVKFFQLFASICGVLGVSIGGLLGTQVSGTQAQPLVWPIIGALIGFAISGVPIVLVRLFLHRFTRPCPVCQSSGQVPYGPGQRILCPKCNGDGRIL